MKTFLLLGSGELGKEFTISAKRYDCKVVAVDKYAHAPAMQVADLFEVIDMLNGEQLQQIVDKHQPDFIVPEIEAIRTQKLADFEKAGITVVPSAKAVHYTMDRKAIRDLAASELKLTTAAYRYAKSEEELQAAAKEIGFPAVVKPLMSSSGKGQSVVKSEKDISKAWKAAVEGARGDSTEVILEEFIDFQSEITLLTVSQRNGKTLFCPPIGHRQERGDYMESWQPADVDHAMLKEAQGMAEAVIQKLGSAGLWGVEFFLSKEKVYFSELSPRPHDTGMVTLAGTQNFNEFELHLRAILGLPIPSIELIRHGANAVILADSQSTLPPVYSGLQEAAAIPGTDFRIFGKPTSRPYRRMGIALASGVLGTSLDELRRSAKKAADCIKVNS
jgi:phosphoribosylglycinamide formyltransferase 2